MVPPRIVRRIVLLPLLFLLTLSMLVVLPVLAVLALVPWPLLPGRWRSVRLVWFGLVWLALESVALFACLGLWVASGFGGRLRSEQFIERHYAVMRWFLSTVHAAATDVFTLRIEVQEPEHTPTELAARLTRPVIVLSRHAGPGDSFLLIHRLMADYNRKPRIVMKAALQLDPGLDVVINRLPNAFVTPGKGIETGIIQAIERLAQGLGPNGALVIFPEGGNFTPRRRIRAIQRLRERRRLEEARRAERLRYLMAPRTGGALAAINAAPGADVVFVAHTGLEDLITLGDIWRSLPMQQVLKARWWRVPAEEVPRDREEQARWLYDWWERIDTWIGENRPDVLPTPTSRFASRLSRQRDRTGA